MIGAGLAVALAVGACDEGATRRERRGQSSKTQGDDRRAHVELVRVPERILREEASLHSWDDRREAIALFSRLLASLQPPHRI